MQTSRYTEKQKENLHVHAGFRTSLFREDRYVVCVCVSVCVCVCVCVYVRVRARSDAHILLANFWGKGRLNLAKSKRYASNSMLHARNPKPEEPLSPP